MTDWEPFEYFSTRISDPARPGITIPETYCLTADEAGTGLRYTMGEATDEAGNRSEISETEAAGFLAGFWAESFREMAVQLKASV